MTKKLKSRFTNTIDKNEFEIGSKNRLMQDAWNPRGGHGTYISDKLFNSYTLDEKIASLQDRMSYLTSSGDTDKNDVKQKQIEEAKLIYDKLMQQKLLEQQGIIEKEKSKANIEVAEINRHAIVIKAEIENDGKIKTAKIEKETQISVAKIQQDPYQISQTEMDVFNIVKKYDFLKDPEAFKNLVNTTTDNNVKTDALSLEKDLSKLGMHLKVDGKIDQNTIDAIESLVSKNAPAIKAYKEVTGIDPLRPSETPASSENGVPSKTK